MFAPSSSAALNDERRSARTRKVFEESRGAARWVAALEIALSAVEKAAWDLRNTYEELCRRSLEGWAASKESLANLDAERRARQTELGRMLDVSFTVSKVVLSYRFTSIKSAFLSRAGRERSLAKAHAHNGGRLYRLAERQQGGLVKIGQILAARTDVLPQELTSVLAGLHDAFAPLPFEAVEAALREAWGDRFAEVKVERDPIGSGSIAQVHRIALADGASAAVKVLRPGIRQVLEYDMANLRRVIDALAAYLPDFDVAPVLDEIETQLLREVDFDAEGEALRDMRARTAGMKWVMVPEVLDAWCAPGVLTTSFVEGRRLDEALAERNAEQIADILFTLAELYALQILQWGVIQPDTHPGNFLVTTEDRIALLDFGCARVLSPAFRRDMLACVEAFIKNDDDAVAASLTAMGFVTRSGDIRTLVATSRGLLGAVLAGKDWDPQKLLEMSDSAIDSMLTDPVVTVPQEFIMVGRALLTLGGLFYTHKPDIDFMSILLPILAETYT